jgi:hypothetical protein
MVTVKAWERRCTRGVLAPGPGSIVKSDFGSGLPLHGSRTVVVDLVSYIGLELSVPQYCSCRMHR